MAHLLKVPKTTKTVFIYLLLRNVRVYLLVNHTKPVLLSIKLPD